MMVTTVYQREIGVAVYTNIKFRSWESSASCLTPAILAILSSFAAVSKSVADTRNAKLLRVKILNEPIDPL